MIKPYIEFEDIVANLAWKYHNCVYHSLRRTVIAVEVNRKGVRCATCGNISHAKERSSELDTERRRVLDIILKI